MASKILFSSVTFDKYSPDATLPSKFRRLIKESGIGHKFTGKTVAIKMHVGRGIGYSTIHPMFVKMLTDTLKESGCNVYITDQVVTESKSRGYTQENLEVPVVPVCGVTNKYIYEKDVDFRTFKNVSIGGNIADADAIIVLSHVKGHGACGYAGACKNIAMGCVNDHTRSQIHSLEGGQEWDESLCIHCNECVVNCNHDANSFDEKGHYNVFYHNCTYCQHCVKVCPTDAIKMTSNSFQDFQTGMAICTEEVLKCFDKENIYYINFLTNITSLCDCWALTTPSLVPDIGIMGSDDIVAIERASIDAIKTEDLLISGLPQGYELGNEGHLFERIHGKNPYVQLDELEKRGLGTQEYELVEIK